ncbi:MAG TPA: serine/threonine-protein kinase, partial [Urbifossiella sp.]|nr:serine/threonine-protein kinase [Urbifossiella sp.]
MPAPASVPEFLDLVQKSGVADEAKLKAYLDRVGGPAALPAEPSKAAGHLVRDGLLTYFQAEQILQGKWKRFTIGKYKVLERLGSGGMGTVFLCEHKLMRRRVAVKVLPTAKSTDQASLERFNREARAAAAVDHPNIVRAFDIDQDENLHFLVMEYVDGTNLQDLVKKAGPLDPVRACHYIYGAAVGLQHAHEMGLIHRDIKPGNVLLDRTGVVKILDMGLARLIHDTDDHITRKYDENILGTADYLSPEQAEDSHTVDIRSDIYSLGATFYFLLSGSQPFPEGTIPQKLIWHRSRQPRSIRDTRPEVPEGVVSIVSRMMAKKPEDRFQTPAEVIAALQPWVSVPIPPPSDQEMPQLSPAVAAALGNRPAAQRAAAGPSLLVGSDPGSGVRLLSSPSMSQV